jgi:hypothetical protein
MKFESQYYYIRIPSRIAEIAPVAAVAFKKFSSARCEISNEFFLAIRDSSSDAAFVRYARILVSPQEYMLLTLKNGICYSIEKPNSNCAGIEYNDYCIGEL